MNTIVLSALVSAIATAVIAIYAFLNYQLTSKIQKRGEEDRQQTRDLFQAIVISNILSNPEANLGSSNLENKIKAFEELYKGKTPIFLTEINEGR